MAGISPLWILPLIVVAAGMAVAALVARRLAAEAEAASTAIEQLCVLADEAASLRDDADRALRRGRALASAVRPASGPSAAGR